MDDDIIPQDIAWKHREMMLKIARKPGFCCCCVCLSREDRRRARRVFRLTRKVMRAWEKEEREAERAGANANEG
jgi:hypothetical protein